MPIIRVIKHLSLFITPTKLLSANLFVITLLLVSGVMMFVHAEEKQVQKIHFTDKEQAWISKHPEVIVGFVSDMQPALIVGENGQHQGILPEFYALLSQHTGINFHIKLSPTWSEMLTEGRKKKTDMIGSFVPNLKFRSHFDFTHAILNTHFYIYGSAEIQPQEFSLDNLSGKQVGYIKAHRNIERWSTKHQNINFITYKDRDSLVNALTTGQAEFLINAEPLEYWRQQNGLISFKKIHVIPELSTDIVMGVRKDWPELTSIINKVLSSTKREQHAIIDHWLGYNKNRATAKNPVQLSTEEKSWIAEHPVIRVGFDPFWAPLEFLGEDGQPKGVSIQYLHQLEKSLGLRFKFAKNLSWPEALKKLELSQLDVLPAVSITHPKRNSFNFTSPYLSTHNGIFSATDRAYLGDVDALKGKRALVIEGYAIQSWLRENYPEVDWVSAPNISTALKEVASGEAFAFVGNLITTSYYIGQSGLTQIKVVGEVSFTNDLAIAVRKDWEILTSILQKGLDAIPQNERDAIYNDWISIKYKHSVDYTLLWQVFGVATLVLLLIIFWNRRLVQEIAHRRKIEAALNHAKIEAEKATEAKAEFLANMSHELRTPLNAVIGTGHLIRQTELTAQQLDYLDKMNASSETLLETINTILDFSKVEAGMLELDIIPFKLEAVVQKVMSDLEIQARQKGLNLNLNINSEGPDALMGDPQKLGQILRNLGSNAIKFTEKGSVDISVDRLEMGADTVSLRFIIKDTGIGISPEQQQKLFQPFTQGDSSITRRYGGTGLGLVISQQLAQLMDGEITLKSKISKGSSFSFIANFKVAKVRTQKNKLSSTKQPSRKVPIPELSGAKVLLVEDDPLNQWVAKELLVGFGVWIEVAENGNKALDVLEKESFDIVLMDLQMPEMDGYETVSIIRQEKKWSDLPIIAMTAHALPQECDKCLAAGMNDYLTKPINPVQLQDMLLKWTTTIE